MKKLLTYLSILLATACGAANSGIVANGTTVLLSKPNFNVVETSISAQADAQEIFCLIPTNDSALYRKAMHDLVKSAQLKRNQTLVNIRQDISSHFYVLMCTRTLTLSADVIEFKDDSKMNSSVTDQTKNQTHEAVVHDVLCVKDVNVKACGDSAVIAYGDKNTLYSCAGEGKPIDSERCENGCNISHCN